MLLSYGELILFLIKCVFLYVETYFTVQKFIFEDTDTNILVVLRFVSLII